MSTGGNQTQGPTSWFNDLRNWVSNLSRRVRIGAAVGSLAAVVSIGVGVVELMESLRPPEEPPVPIKAELQNPAELEFDVSRETYLRDVGKPTKEYSGEQLQERGVLISADADIEGLEDQELTLRYTLYDNETSRRVSRLANKEAETIVPETSEEELRSTAFVPYPPGAGEYYISLSLHRQNEVALSELDSDPFIIHFAGPQPPEDPITVLERLYATENTSSFCSGCRWQTDNTGALEIQVPSGWSDVDRRGWVRGQGIVGPGLSASPNLADFTDTWSTPGVQFLASSVNPRMWDYLDQYMNYRDSCQHEGRHNYSDGLYLGHYDIWENCGGTDTVLVNLVAWTGPDVPYMASVSVQLTGETDIEAANAVFGSFDVVQALPSQTVPATTTATTTATSPSTAAPDNFGGASQEREPTENLNFADLEAEAEEAAGAYYRAAGSEDWAYTYEYLDAETQSMFTEEEWFNKNQWFADNGSVTYHIVSVDLNSASQEPVAEVALRLTYEDGSTATRSTHFVLEDGVWKHRFMEEEVALFMPEASYEEFVAAKR